MLERSARATITFPAAGTSPSVGTTPARPGWLYPAIAGLAIVLLLGSTALVVRGRRLRATEKRYTPPSGAPTPASAGVRKPVGLIR